MKVTSSLLLASMLLISSFPAAEADGRNSCEKGFILSQDQSGLGRQIVTKLGKSWIQMTFPGGGYDIVAYAPTWDVYVVSFQRKIYKKLAYADVRKNASMFRWNSWGAGRDLRKPLRSEQKTIGQFKFVDYIFAGETGTKEIYLSSRVKSDPLVVEQYRMRNVQLPAIEQQRMIITRAFCLPLLSGIPYSVVGERQGTRRAIWQLRTKSLLQQSIEQPDIRSITSNRVATDVSDVAIGNYAREGFEEFARGKGDF